MNASVKLRVKRMLGRAYRRLGMQDVTQIQEWIREAMEYLELDREHYIEPGEPDTPEYRITEKNGIICKLIPLAREVTRQQERDYFRVQTTVLSLSVTENNVRYVTETSHAKLHDDPVMNSWTYPVCRFVDLADIDTALQLLSPRQIRPVATVEDWKIYTMIFAVFDRCCPDRPANTVPHKTERAMIAVSKTLPEQLQVDGETVTGKVIPLAAGQSHEEMREDHRHSYASELCILVGKDNPRYLLKTRHTYSYFRKVIYDDAPGGCSYEPTGEKWELTWSFVSPEDIREQMDPYFY